MFKLESSPGQPNMPALSTKRVVWIGLMAWLIYIAQNIHREHVYTRDWDSESIERFHTNTTFIRHEVPITYYKRGELHRVLPGGGWLSGAGLSALRVFRMEEGESFDFDIGKVQAPLRVNHVNDKCANDHGLCLCKDSCVDWFTMYSGDAQSILNGTARDYFAGFTSIDDRAIDYFESVLKWPGKLDRGFVGQTFVSNLKTRYISAHLHGDPAQSMAIQFIGSKTWLFFKAEDYLSSTGFHSIPSSPAFTPTKGPSREQMDYFVYKSKPGDILFFPTNYAHTVATDPGPNIMTTFRKVYPLHWWKNPVNAVHLVLNVLFFSPLVTAKGVADKERPLGDPQTELASFMINSKCPKVCDDKSPCNIDRLLPKLLLDSADMMDVKAY